MVITQWRAAAFRQNVALVAGLFGPRPTAHDEESAPMIELLSNPQAWIAFATLTALELVLGIDNIIFISILVDKLP